MNFNNAVCGHIVNSADKDAKCDFTLWHKLGSKEIPAGIYWDLLVFCRQHDSIMSNYNV